MSSNNENSTGDNNFGDNSPPVAEQTVKRLTLDKEDIDSLTRISNKICDYVIEMFMNDYVEDNIKACAPIIVNCCRTEFQQVLNNGLTITDIINFPSNVEERMNEQNIDDISSETFYMLFMGMTFPNYKSQIKTFVRTFLEGMATILKYIEENVDRTIHIFGQIREYIEQLEFSDNDINVVLEKIERMLSMSNDCDYLSMIENILHTDDTEVLGF